MNQSSPCPECGGTRALASVANDMRWSVSHMYSGAHTFRALICTHCGHTTFYAQGFRDIEKELGQQAQQGKK